MLNIAKEPLMTQIPKPKPDLTRQTLSTTLNHNGRHYTITMTFNDRDDVLANWDQTVAWLHYLLNDIVEGDKHEFPLSTRP